MTIFDPSLLTVTDDWDGTGFVTATPVTTSSSTTITASDFITKIKKPKRLPCPFKVGDRVRVLKEHDGNRSAINQVGLVTHLSTSWEKWYANVRLTDIDGVMFRKCSEYSWMYPVDKLTLVPYEDGLDNWE